jgi:hypothetical protein
MTDESAFEAGAIGFLLGLFFFAGLLVRVNSWVSRRRQSRLTSDAGSDDNRYSPAEVVARFEGGLRGVLDNLPAFDEVIDLLFVVFFVAMHLYGAWVAPRLRPVLAVSVATIVVCSFSWFKIASWVARRRSESRPALGKGGCSMGGAT